MSVSVQRWTACWLVSGTTGDRAACGVGRASNNEFDASSRNHSTAAAGAPETPSRRPSATEPAARSLERRADSMNSEVSLFSLVQFSLIHSSTKVLRSCRRAGSPTETVRWRASTDGQEDCFR